MTTEFSIEQITAFVAKGYRSVAARMTQSAMDHMGNQPGKKDFRNLVDIVWNHAYEDTSVPSTAVADKIIGQWLRLTVPAPLDIDVWDWVVTKGGKVVQITADDMPELPYEEIARKATVKDMAELLEQVTEWGELKGYKRV